jgi:chemotaxis signal transduction protein
MKKLWACIAVLLSVTFTPIQSNAEKNPISISVTDVNSAEVKVLINRVNEINAMDRSAMSPAEKKEIRKELRAIKREVNKHSGGYVYISGGLLILIIILLIIF